MSARALELISLADVILHDRLIPEGALDGARADAELVFVGKEGGGQLRRPAADRGADARARACGPDGGAPEGRRPVRVRPRGRGGAHAAGRRASRSRSCPGVTAGIAAPAYAGIPVTQRGVASAVALVTGHEDPAKPESDLDWHGAGGLPGDARAVHGGRPPRADRRRADRRRAPRLRAGRGRAGRHAAGPAHGAGSPSASSPRRSPQAGVRPPAITVVGPVSELAEQIAWHTSGPLAGRTVAVTRARAQASDMARRLRALGARVIEAPVIRIRPLAARPRAARPLRLRPDLPHQPQRGAAAVRAARRGRPSTPARWPARRWR